MRFPINLKKSNLIDRKNPVVFETLQFLFRVEVTDDETSIELQGEVCHEETER